MSVQHVRYDATERIIRWFTELLVVLATVNHLYGSLAQTRGLYESVEYEKWVTHILHLIGVRKDTVSLPGFDYEEVDGLLEMFYCDLFNN